MKRFIASFIVGLAALSGHAFALVGGPFDNGLFTGTENNSVYQGAMSLLNGSGYCYFSPDALMVDEVPGSNAYNQRASLRNRSVVYYKGVTYVGSAFGMVDGEARYIQCDLNGSSDVSLSAQISSTSSNFFTFSQNTVNTSSVVTQTNRSYTFNGTWEGKITRTSPTLKFTGSGELSFIAPTGPDTVASVAYNGYNNLILQIGNYFGSVLIGTPDFQAAADAVDQALLGLKAQLSQAGIDTTFKNAEIRHVSVRGSRRYL